MADAAREKLDEVEKSKVLKELLKSPATFKNIKNSSSYIKKMRKLDNKRLKRLAI